MAKNQRLATPPSETPYSVTVAWNLKNQELATQSSDTPYSVIVARNLKYLRKYLLQASQGGEFTGLAPLGAWGPDVTDAPGHRQCEYCLCQCSGRRGTCVHCRFYVGSTPQRCYGELGMRSGSIAYLLRHQYGREGPVEESLILRVASAFKRAPLDVPLVDGRQPSESAILDMMTPRQLWCYAILTGTHGLDDQVFSLGNGHLCSINEAAEGRAIYRQHHGGVAAAEYEADHHQVAISMWLEFCVDPFIYEV